ncbi:MULTISPECIES: alcohol dehydrogenase catalytic domain-containing protein [unclassified Streptomyces]|uniref:zinc-dependent alcohol dehydrogenase n=1 Tax=unclassified Streptomyces TaxID=2593676 RepID=UPI0033D5CF41
MKAAVLTAPRRIETVDDWPEPECGPHDVLVRLEGMGVCGSDLAVFDGDRAVPALPWVVGHEGFGRIVAVGGRVVDRAVGQRVVIEPNYACLDCPECARGLTSACTKRVIVGMNAPGLLAERIAVPAPFAHPVPDTTDPADLACAEPYTVARTAVRRGGVGAGDKTLVVGAGAQGLLLCQALLAIGVRPAVVEPHPRRLAHAEVLGARAADDGEGGFTYVFESSGVAAALGAALERTVPGATAVLVGLGSAGLPLSVNQLVRSQLTLRGSLIYDHPGDFTAALADITSGAVRPGAAIDARFPLEDAQEAFAGARERAGKTWISLDPEDGGRNDDDN